MKIFYGDKIIIILCQIAVQWDIFLNQPANTSKKTLFLYIKYEVKWI